MIKWLILLLFAVPRILYSEILLLFMNLNKKKYSLEKRYSIVRKTAIWVNYFLRVDMNITQREIITTPHSKGRVYVSNHHNVYEVIALLVLSEKPLIFISKKENKKVPILNTHLKAIDTLCIDRKDIRQSLRICKEAGKLAKNGFDIVIFAEGTRSKDGNVAPFKAALPTIIHYSESETILICMHNTQKPLSWHFITYPKEHVNIRFFEPLTYDFYLQHKKEFNEVTRNMIQNQIEIYREKGVM